MKMCTFINLRCGENILYTIWCFYTHDIKKVLILQGVNKINFFKNMIKKSNIKNSYFWWFLKIIIIFLNNDQVYIYAFKE